MEKESRPVANISIAPARVGAAVRKARRFGSVQSLLISFFGPNRAPTACDASRQPWDWNRRLRGPCPQRFETFARHHGVVFLTGLISSIWARRKKSVSVAPGISTVTVTPVSSTQRPRPRATLSLVTRFAVSSGSSGLPGRASERPVPRGETRSLPPGAAAEPPLLEPDRPRRSEACGAGRVRTGSQAYSLITQTVLRPRKKWAMIEITARISNMWMSPLATWNATKPSSHATRRMKNKTKNMQVPPAAGIRPLPGDKHPECQGAAGPSVFVIALTTGCAGRTSAPSPSTNPIENRAES